MIRSMTGFASAQGALALHSWNWELRSVNAKGLDLRLRVPDWLDGLEAALRKELTKSLARGNVTLSLRLSREDSGAGFALNPELLAEALAAVQTIESEAAGRGIVLAPTRASDLLGLRGMTDSGPTEDDPAPIVKQILSEAPALIRAFVEMRETEGAALLAVLTEQLDRMQTLTAQAATLAEARKDSMAETLRANLAKVLDNADGVDPDRLAQEIAVIAVKSDVTEEIDRLGAHVNAARDLLTKGGPIGRKLDFLMQEFNREANTLCSKSQNADLTAVGLELKAVIDQMREQVQNIE